MLTRNELAEQYLAQLPYAPYPVQEEALLAWFLAEEGVLVCAPTGTGKTLIAQAALFEALHTRKVAYYTTPLIALTDQKFQEMHASAVRWGFSADQVGYSATPRSASDWSRAAERWSGSRVWLDARGRLKSCSPPTISMPMSPSVMAG
jgi:CRISPR/Cas system-associated endonuclease/helicase Cas3